MMREQKKIDMEEISLFQKTKMRMKVKGKEGGANLSPLSNLLQGNSCLENPIDRGAWQATVHGVPKSWIRLKPISTRELKKKKKKDHKQSFNWNDY